MEDILKLIEIKKRKGHRSIQLLNQNFRKSEISKDNQLYEFIIKEGVTTDDDAAKSVFKSDPNNRNYRNAKSKLRHKLLNHLFFLDFEKKGSTQYQKYEYDSYNDLHQARILKNEGATELAIKKLLALLKLAKICELVDVVVQALVLLREIYAKDGKLGFYSEVGLALDYYLNFQSAIRESEDLYYKELVQINKSFSAQTRILDNIPQSIEQIKKKAVVFNSTRIDTLAQKLELLYSQITDSFSQVVEICDQIEAQYFHRKDGELRVDFKEHEVYLTKCEALYQLNAFDKVNEFCEEKQDVFRVGNRRWIQFSEFRFLSLLNSRRYKEAGELFRGLKGDKGFQNSSQLDKDRWIIYRAFLIYFHEEKLIKWGFNLSHFLNYKLDYPKEYAGYAIAILSIRFLYFLRDNDLKGVNETLDELEPFNSSHLDKRSNYRNSVFIRLLNLVPENDFSYDAVAEKGQIYLQKLKTTLIPQDKYADLEVIRYETLWEEILHTLKHNKEYVHFKFYHYSVG